MINVYMPMGCEGYEVCQTVEDTGDEVIDERVIAARRGAPWPPLEVRVVHEHDGEQFLHTACPWMGSHVLILRRNAIRAIAPMLEGTGELLDLECSEDDLVLYNPTRVIDALDEERSVLSRFPDGRLIMVHQYSFRRESLKPGDVFRIPNLRVSPILVTDRFVDAWRAAGLSGLRFKKLWSSD